MKAFRNVIIGFLLAAVGLSCGAATAASTSELLQQGLYADEVEGDIDSAIEIYQRVIQDTSAPRNHIAQALYRQGVCYMKNKDEESARKVLGRLVDEYSDQGDIVEKARSILEDLTEFDPAALMPPETLIYIELGSPGRQVETLLNMLKDTPFENPLAVIGGQSRGNTNQKSPADIMAAIFNPSMMAEFKKIRGFAVGVTGIAQNNPPMILVLYPGESDALRGMIMAGLGMVGTAGEPIEGMQTLSIQNEAEVAYDDKVILITPPGRQLQQCVRRYKGLSSEPTLASTNRSFSKISKKQRQNNALTIWADVDEAYKRLLQMFSPGQVPQEILLANSFADFGNIDYLTYSGSIEPDGMSDSIEIIFKEGHNSLVYDLIRTPNLNKSALQAVPSDAVAFASFALSASNSSQAETIQKQVHKITGLDIGREIFSNLEQITVFAAQSKQANPFVPAQLCISVTSHNPYLTRQILARGFGTANSMLGGEATGDVNILAERYQVGMFKGNPLYCYVGQSDKATILSINPEVVKASVAAIKDGNNVCGSGPLSGCVSMLSPDTSKLVLVNAGGALRLAAPAILEGKFDKERRDALMENVEKLAKAVDKTTIELYTEENVNSFTLNRRLRGLPALNQIFGPAYQISEIIKKAESEAKIEKLRQGIAAVITATTTAPVIDGDEDEVWSAARSYKVSNQLFAPLSSPNDLSATYKFMWGADNLYVFVDVTDDSLKNDSSAEQWWFDDSVEVYIDADNSKAGQYDENDAQYHFDWDQTNPTMDVHDQHGNTNNVEYVMVTTDKGYRVEIKFPWSTIGGEPKVGGKIGFDVHVNDDDDGGERDTKLSWHDADDTAWSNPQAFGNTELAGMVGWWRFDETEGGIAKDSSGGNHDGILNGNAKWAQGKIGGAIDLDGDGDFVRISDEKAFDISGEITISCWVNIRTTPNEWTAIVTKGDNSWRLSLYENQRRFHASTGDWQQNKVDGNVEVAANQWHHVAVVYDGKQVCIYIDGEVDVCKEWTGGIGQNDYDVLIGENAQENGRYFDGLIDEVRIYNYALSAQQVSDLYEGK